MAEKKNVFISHYHKDEEWVDKMRDLLGDKYELRNSSVESSKEETSSKDKSNKEIETRLEAGINWAGAFICIIGEHTAEREWVDKEIKMANDAGKQIIGVWIHGKKDKADLPDNFEKYGDALVAWTSNSLANALDGKLENSFEAPDGSSRAPTFKQHRQLCQ